MLRAIQTLSLSIVKVILNNMGQVIEMLQVIRIPAIRISVIKFSPCLILIFRIRIIRRNVGSTNRRKSFIKILVKEKLQHPHLESYTSKCEKK